MDTVCMHVLILYNDFLDYSENVYIMYGIKAMYQNI